MTDEITLRILKDQTSRVLRELHSKKIKGEMFGFEKSLFPKQRAFINDPAKRKTALTDRRSGKTFCIKCYLAKEALKAPNGVCLYLAKTRLRAKQLMFRPLEQLIHQYHLGGISNTTELSFHFDNGSEIWLSGLDSEKDAEKWRGSAFKLVVLDESGHFSNFLDYVLVDIISPALLDHDGTLAMIGTPSAACVGAFYEATTDPKKGYSNHEWSLEDNIYLPNRMQWLKEEMERNGWTENSPTFLREYRHQWVHSAEGLVYAFTDKNISNELMPCTATVMGLDLGWHDATAFSIIGFSDKSPNAQVLESYKKKHLNLTQIVEIANQFIAKYNPRVIRADTGGLGKTIAEELINKYGLDIKPAKKVEKFAFIEVLNDNLRSGRLTVYEPKNKDLIAQFKTLQYDETGKIEHPDFENDLCDATLYGFRESEHYQYLPEVPELKPTDDAYMDKIAEDLEDAMLNDQEKEWWER